MPDAPHTAMLPTSGDKMAAADWVRRHLAARHVYMDTVEAVDLVEGVVATLLAKAPTSPSCFVHRRDRVVGCVGCERALHQRLEQAS